MLLLSGIALLILGYEMNQAGRAMASLWVVAHALEADLGLPEPKSLSFAALASFRSLGAVTNLLKLGEAVAKENWFFAAGHIPGYSIFHLRYSRTASVATIIGILQVSVVVVLLLFGKLSL